MKRWYEEMYDNCAMEYDKDLKEWYEKLFVNLGRESHKEPLIKGTGGEVDFIESELGFDKRVAILDIGCGTGRHAIELAKRGYQVTAVDLSGSQLARARVKAAAAHVEVHFVKADALYLDYNDQFDVVTMLNSAFGLMETDELNFNILKNVSLALRQRGMFILVAMNGLYPLFHSIKDNVNACYEQDVVKASTFDLMTFRQYSEYEHVDDDGNRHRLTSNERCYIPPEITWLLKTVDFSEIDIYGAKLGKWSRDKKLSTEDRTMLVVAQKDEQRDAHLS